MKTKKDKVCRWIFKYLEHDRKKRHMISGKLSGIKPGDTISLEDLGTGNRI